MATREEIEKRRAAVWEQVARGVSPGVIARSMNLSDQTIRTDIKVLREQHRDGVTSMEPPAEVGDIVAKFDEVYMEEYSTVERPSQKSQFLDKALCALNSKCKLLLETGYIPKAAQEIKNQVKIEGIPDISRASLPELKAVRERLLTQLAKIQSDKDPEKN
jgi:hypothetical protein